MVAQGVGVGGGGKVGERTVRELGMNRYTQ